MAKIKYTKNELKAQRDALSRFKRYLPTLQLKKQQLQVELRQLDALIREKAEEETHARDRLAEWVQLFSESIDLSKYLRILDIKTSRGNIAGVNIPVLDEVVYDRETPDLFATPPWIDNGLQVVEQLIRLRVERKILEEQSELLSEELRTTTQRVNLFEKVKIPEAQDHIRTIRIFLGDQQTAAVARSKIAKNKSTGVAQAA